MVKPIPKRFLVALLVVIVAINMVAYWKHLYFFVWWLDIPMHLASGFWVAAFVSSFFASSTAHSHAVLVRPLVFWAALGVAMSVGIIWELFEFNLDRFIVFAPHDLPDTLSDLFFDLLGAILGAVYVLVGRHTPTPVTENV